MEGDTMNGLLNLSEPGFLAVYLVGLSIAVQWARVARRRTRRGKGVRPRRPLSLEELAYLAGGPRRVTETAVTRLVESGALRLAPHGTVQAAGSPSRDPIDEAVLAEAQAGDSAVALVAMRAARQDVVTAVGHRLTDLGLIVDPRVARTRLRTAVLPLLVVSVLGLVRWANDIVRGQPAGWLTALLVITAAVGILLAHSSVPHRTVRGTWVLHEANTNFHAVVDAECPLAGVARLVALGGLAAGRDLIVAGSRAAQPGNLTAAGSRDTVAAGRERRLADQPSFAHARLSSEK
jgi:uncharacterized protein (TIGR04222 family)